MAARFVSFRFYQDFSADVCSLERTDNHAWDKNGLRNQGQIKKHYHEHITMNRTHDFLTLVKPSAYALNKKKILSEEQKTLPQCARPPPISGHYEIRRGYLITMHRDGTHCMCDLESPKRLYDSIRIIQISPKGQLP